MALGTESEDKVEVPDSWGADKPAAPGTIGPEKKATPPVAPGTIGTVEKPVAPKDAGAIGIPEKPSIPVVPGVIGREDINTPRTVKSSDIDSLPYGAKFIAEEDPSKKIRTKIHVINSPEDFSKVGDGEKFLATADPTKKVRVKPRYEGVGLDTQALWNMAETESERKKILSREFGEESVKSDPFGNLYAERDGKLYAPGRGSMLKRGAAFAASEAAPIGGAILGTVSGAALGGGVGGLAGAGVGSAAGQGVNDSIMALAGVYDRPIGEELGGLGKAAAGGAIGEGLGRAAFTGGRAIYDVAKATGNVGPASAAAYLLGATVNPEATKLAASLASKGVQVPPSAWLKEAPMLHKIVEQFDPAFRRQNVLVESARNYYEKTGTNILKELGITDSQLESLGSLTNRKSAPSSLEAGEAAQGHYIQRMVSEDAALAEAHAAAKNTAMKFGESERARHAQSLSDLTSAVDQNVKAAQGVVDNTWSSIKSRMNSLVGQFGENTSSLWNQVVGDLDSAARGVRQRYGILANQAYERAGSEPVDLSGVKDAATNLLKALPAPFRGENPLLVEKLTQLSTDASAPRIDADGFISSVPSGPRYTLKEAHELKKLFSENVDWGTLTRDREGGALAKFTSLLNKAIKPTGEKVPPDLRAAGEILTKADEFYAKNYPTFKENLVRSVVRAAEHTNAPDYEHLAATIFTGKNTSLIESLKKNMKPETWDGIVGAETQRIFRESASHIPGQIDAQRFASEILKRSRNGSLEHMGPEMAGKLAQQARNLELLGGRLDVSSLPGDTMATLMKRVEDAKAHIEMVAKQNPEKLLKEEMDRVEREAAAMEKEAEDSRRADPLHFLYDASLGATTAARMILRDPDKIRAAAKSFGKDSKEFTLLRQLQAQRVLTTDLEKTESLHRRLGQTEADVQEILFPGVSLKDMHTLAKEMQLLSSRTSDVGGSMAAASKITNPISQFPLAMRGTLAVPIIGSVAARFALGKMFALVSDTVTGPTFIKWIADAVEHGSPHQVMLARKELAKRAGLLGGKLGAAAGATISNQENQQ